MKLEHLPQEFIRAIPVLEKIQTAGFEAYFVGGSVRDALLGNVIHDVDIATSAYPEEIKTIFPNTIDIGIDHGTVLVLTGKNKDEQYEITTFRTESTYTDYRRPDHVDFVRELREDLKRRDFTINAMAVDINGEIIDLFDGMTDLSEKRLRAVGIAEERFSEDALRTLRAMRFAATLDFDIEPITFQAIKSHACLLEKISIERIFIELDKLLLASNWKKGMLALINSGTWKYLPDFMIPNLTDLTDKFQFKNSAQAWTWLVLQFNQKLNLKKWKMSNEKIKMITQLVSAYQLTHWSLTSIYIFGFTNAQLIDDLKSAQGLFVNVDVAKNLYQQLQIHKRTEIVINGEDLIAQGIKPGPILGKLLKDIEQKIVKNELKNERKEILDYVRLYS